MAFRPGDRAHRGDPGRPGGGARTKLPAVEALFTTLLVLAGVAITWFAVYVVYRLYADQR